MEKSCNKGLKREHDLSREQEWLGRGLRESQTQEEERAEVVVVGECADTCSFAAIGSGLQTAKEMGSVTEWTGFMKSSPVEGR